MQQKGKETGYFSCIVGAIDWWNRYGIDKYHKLISPGARFSKAPETLGAPKVIFSSFVSKNGEVYTPETSCVKRTSVYVKNT